MTSNIESDGKTVTVTTDEGHRIGFAMAELNAASTSGEITTHWAGGVPPASVERTVAAAKTEAEAFAEQHHPDAPGKAQAAKEQNKGLGGTLKDMLGLP